MNRTVGGVVEGGKKTLTVLRSESTQSSMTNDARYPFICTIHRDSCQECVYQPYHTTKNEKEREVSSGKREEIVYKVPTTTKKPEKKKGKHT